MDWFLYDRDLHHERVKGLITIILELKVTVNQAMTKNIFRYTAQKMKLSIKEEILYGKLHFLCSGIRADSGPGI